MRNNYMYSIAAFMIALIISIPLYSSAAFASLTALEIHGNSHKVSRYYKSFEGVYINVTAHLAGDTEIEESQLNVSADHIPQGREFSECTRYDDAATQNTFHCNYYIPNSGMITQPETTWVISLYDDNGVLQESTPPLKTYFDDRIPTINSLTVSPTITKEGDITIEFDVEDTANVGTDGICSGLKRLELYSSDFPLSPFYQVPLPGDCDERSPPNIVKQIGDIVDLSNPLDREITITIEVYDKMTESLLGFNNDPGIGTATLFYDTGGPIINANSLSILNSSSGIITYISDKPITNAKVNFTITDPSLNPTSVYADINNLNEDDIAGYEHMGATCTEKDDDYFICSIEGITLKVTSDPGPITLSIDVEATDFAGTTSTSTLYTTLVYDATPPTITSIKTNNQDLSGNYYIGNHNNTIMVEITETGIGLYDKNIFLDLTQITGANNVQADQCDGTIGAWTCYWRDIVATTDTGIKEIIVNTNSEDDLENKITDVFRSNVRVDTDEPIIQEITYTPLTPTSADTDPLVFNIKAEENASELYIRINTTEISSTDIHSETCTSSNKSFNCFVDVTDLVSSYVEADVEVKLMDPATNFAIQEKQVTIFQADAETVPNFFSMTSKEVIPSRLDRKVGSLLPINVYVHIVLEGDAEITTKLIDCTNMGSLIDQDYTYLMNEYEDDPFLALKLSPTDVALIEEGANIPISCDLLLEVRKDQVIYTQHEVENITATIELYGNALGEIDDNVQKKLDGIQEDIKDVEEDIDAYEKWIKIFGGYCGIAKTIGELNQAMQALKSIAWMILMPIHTFCVACCGSPGAIICCPCAALTWALWTAICTSAQIVLNIADGFFWPMGGFVRIFAHWWTGLGWILKICCMVFYECALANWDNILSAIGASLPADWGGGGFWDGATAYSRGDVIEDDNGNVFYRDDDDGVWKNADTHSPAMTTGADGKPTPMTDSLARSKMGWQGAYAKDGNGDDVFRAIGKDKWVNVKSGEELNTQQVNEKLGDMLEGRQTPDLGGAEDINWDKGRNQFELKESLKLRSKQALGDLGSGVVETGKNALFLPAFEDKATKKAIWGKWENYEFLERDNTGNIIWVGRWGDDAEWKWSTDVQGTSLEGKFSGNYLFNPYESIHYAKWSMCLPAIVYNWKKDKQIKCMYKNCIQNTMQAGMPGIICDKAYKERECLYVESAQYLKHGFSEVFDNLVKALISYMVQLLVGTIVAWACTDVLAPLVNLKSCKIAPLPANVFAFRAVACGLLQAAITIREFQDFQDTKFGYDNRMDLEGPDFCED